MFIRSYSNGELRFACLNVSSALPEFETTYFSQEKKNGFKCGVFFTWCSFGLFCA